MKFKSLFVASVFAVIMFFQVQAVVLAQTASPTPDPSPSASPEVSPSPSASPETSPSPSASPTSEQDKSKVLGATTKLGDTDSKKEVAKWIIAAVAALVAFSAAILVGRSKAEE